MAPTSHDARPLVTWLGLCLLALAVSLTPVPAMAQTTALLAPPTCTPPGPGTPANFAIDGVPTCVGTAEDWFSMSLSCTGVLLNSPFGAPNPLRLPVLFTRDSTANSIGPYAADVSVFSSTSNKNNDLIGTGQSPWTWGVGSVPQKDDLTEVYLHARTDIDGHIWIILANAHRSTDGDKHTDYEFNVAGITQTGSLPGGGQLIGNGPNGGRTTGKDFVITVDYINGGAQACVNLWRWNGAAYDSVGIPAGASYSAINQVATPVPGDVMATTSQYGVARQYEPLQFVEAGVDITSLLPDLNATDLCSPTATVLVKTRSSQSFTAELKDFALAHFNIITPPSLVAGNDGPGCVGGTVNLTATADPAGGTFSWTGPNSFTSTAQNPVLSPLTLAMAGKYYVSYLSTDGCSNVDSTVVVVNPATSAAAGPDSAACSANGVYTFVAHGSGANGTASWAVTAGSAVINPTSGSFTPTVTVTGSATIRLTVTGTPPCPPATDDVAFVVHTEPTASAGPDSTACSANGVYTFVAHGSGTNGTPSWSVTAGTAVVTPASGSFTPKVTVTGSATIRLTVTGDATCPPKHDDVAFVVNTAPGAVAGPDSAACSANGIYTFVAHGSGTNGTPAWAVTAGSAVINPASGSFTPTVTVTGSATLRLTVTGDPTCPPATDDVAFVVHTEPTASAGPDSTACSANGIYTFVAHGSGTNGTPSWSVIAGTAVVTPASGSFTPKVTVTGSATIRLTVTGDATCPPKHDDVAFVVNTAPTAAAGPDSTACSLSGVYTFVAHGSGTNGTPAWSVTAGSAVITPASGSFTPKVTVTGSATLHLTVTGDPTCPPATDDVSFVVNTAPTANAGPDSTACSANGIYTFVAHGSGSGGTPGWTVVTGTATIVPTSGSFTPKVTVTGSATIRLNMTGDATCPPASDDVAFVVNTAPTASAGADSTACSANGIFAFVAHGSGSGGTPTWSVVSGTAVISPLSGSFTPKVTVTGAACIRVSVPGTAPCPPATDDACFTVNTAPTANAGPDTSACATSPDNLFKLHGSATGMVSVLWQVIAGSATITSPTSLITDVHTTGPSATLTLTVTGQPGCPTAPDTVKLTVDPKPVCSLSAPGTLPQCASPGNQLCATATGAATYLWSVTSGDASWQITAGQGTDCITYTAGNGGTTGEFKLVVTSNKGCVDSCAVSFTCSSSQYFCTLTQGAYGNPNGMFNGMRRLELLQTLITASDPLVVGKKGVGARSLTVNDGSQSCIILRLPANGTPTTLPAGLGDAVLDPVSCQTSPVVLPVKNTKFVNVFLGQVITLSLNSRLDAKLPSLQICKNMTTVRAITGPDGKPAPDPSDLGTTFTIESRIFTALANLALPKTVGGLLELANRGLAGLPTDVATIGDLNSAVSAINEGFDECRFLSKCLDGEDGPIATGGNGGAIDEGQAPSVALPTEFAISASAPNPFTRMTSVRLALPERSQVRMSVYNILGQEVAELANGEFAAGFQTVQWSATSRTGNPVAPGIYFFRVRAVGMVSRHEVSRIQKVVFVR